MLTPLTRIFDALQFVDKTELFGHCRLEDNRITGDQISSFCWDGAYFKCHVDKLVREKMGRTEQSLPCSHDWMHCCGLVDKHLCERSEHKWVETIVKICQQIYHKVCTLTKHSKDNVLSSMI